VLRDPSGHLVDGIGGPIQIPRNVETIEIAPDGSIRADGEDIGRLRVVRFENPAALQRLDSAGFDAAGMEPIDVQDTRVLQGQVESSNVNPLTEMSDMITHFRLFESQQKLLQTTDQILGSVTRELGKF
jgi:flagellar basal-body rod protein FlgF/flagellar basal-body rod protein FlgG